MRKNKPQENQAPPAPKRVMSDFLKALLWTAIPIVVLSLIVTGGMAAAGENGVGTFEGLWVIAVLMWVAAIVSLVVFTALRKGRIAMGLLVGIGIGIVFLALSFREIVVFSGGAWF